MPMADSGSRLLTPGKDHQDPEQAVEDAGQPTPKQCIVSEKQHIPAIYLPRQVYIIWLVLAYAAILCTAWIILAWTSKRPFGRSSYNCYDEAGYCRFRSEEQAFQNKRTLRYIADAQTLLSAVALLTIPLTSAVCAAAAVPWLQRRGQKMSVRQLMTLADKGWTSPYVYSKLVSASGWKRYGSSFIALALLLNALGAALSPAITRLASLQNIKVPTNGAMIIGVVDVEDLVAWGGDFVLPLRDKLSTGQPSDYVPRMWQHVMPNCTRTASPRFGSDYGAGPCDVGGLTLETLAEAPEAWISQLPGGFNTGVKTNQVVPRINSSVSVERIDGLPEVCNGGSGVGPSLLINHAGQADEYIDGEGNVTTAKWFTKLCIPTQPDSNNAPFASTNDMQTIQETAYIETYSMLIQMDRYHAAHRISINTTIGNFQLPNYILDNRPGPLMKRGNPPSRPYERRMTDSFPSQHNSTALLIDGSHTPGPLLAIVYALFGDGSLPAIYSELNTTYKMVEEEPTDYNYPCLLSSPLHNLAEPYVPDLNVRSSPCLQPAVIRNGGAMYGFLYVFNQSTPVLEKVFRAAAYMYHDVLFSQASSGVGSGRVEYDAGADLQKPALSDGSIIGLTIVIAVFLACLLSLALYASLTRTWTSSLDAYAMMRIGAELGPDAIPFLAVKDPDFVVELDELPGWVGNVAGREEKTGVLGLGYNKAARELDGKEKYKAYDKRWKRGKWRMFEYYLTGIFSCGGTRNTGAPQKARNLRKLASRVYRWITWPTERMRESNQRYQAQFHP